MNEPGMGRQAISKNEPSPRIQANSDERALYLDTSKPKERFNSLWQSVTTGDLSSLIERDSDDDASIRFIEPYVEIKHHTRTNQGY